MSKVVFTDEEKDFILKNRHKLYIAEIAQKLNKGYFVIYSFLYRNKLGYKKEKEREKDGLSRKEQEVIELMAQGLTDKEIASKLCIASSTVVTHKNNIYQAYGVSGSTARVRAVLQYLKNKGILKNE